MNLERLKNNLGKSYEGHYLLEQEQEEQIVVPLKQNPKVDIKNVQAPNQSIEQPLKFQPVELSNQPVSHMPTIRKQPHNFAELDINKFMRCPYSQSKLKDPVVLSDGYSYEKLYVKKLLRPRFSLTQLPAQSKIVSPLVPAFTLDPQVQVENKTLKIALDYIQNFMEKERTELIVARKQAEQYARVICGQMSERQQLINELMDQIQQKALEIEKLKDSLKKEQASQANVTHKKKLIKKIKRPSQKLTPRDQNERVQRYQKNRLTRSSIFNRPNFRIRIPSYNADSMDEEQSSELGQKQQKAHQWGAEKDNSGSADAIIEQMVSRLDNIEDPDQALKQMNELYQIISSEVGVNQDSMLGSQRVRQAKPQERLLKDRLAERMARQSRLNSSVSEEKKERHQEKQQPQTKDHLNGFQPHSQALYMLQKQIFSQKVKQQSLELLAENTNSKQIFIKWPSGGSDSLHSHQA